MRNHRKINRNLRIVADPKTPKTLVAVVFVITVLFATAFVLYEAQATQNEPTYVSADDATEIVARYTYGPTTNLDEMMYDYGYYPTNRTGGACSWVNSQDQIWLDIQDGQVVAVCCRAGFDQCVWEVPDGEYSTRFVLYQGDRCEISTQALAALISVADGHYDGFRNV